MKNEVVVKGASRELKRVENSVAWRSDRFEEKRVEPIKSNAANSFNGRDPKLAIYLEGYRARPGKPGVWPPGLAN